LPAFSTVSVAQEIARLATQQAVTLTGFCQSERPPLDYAPTLFHQLLQDFVIDIFGTWRSFAGHAAGYLATGSTKPQTCSELCWLHLRGEVLYQQWREVHSGCSASAGAITLNWSSSLKLNTPLVSQLDVPPSSIPMPLN